MVSACLLLVEAYQELINKRNFVFSKIESGIVGNGLIINDDVRKWLNDVEDLQESKASGDEMNNNNKWCSEMIEKIKSLDEKCKFKQFSVPEEPLSEMPEKIKRLDEECNYKQICIPEQISERISSRGVPTLFALCRNPTLTPGVDSTPAQRIESIFYRKYVSSSSSTKDLESFPSGNFEYYFNSTNQAKDNLLKALKNDRYYVIGLYGKRGSGKTALVKAELDKYEEAFDRVIFPTVSRNQDVIKSFQVGIANKLNLYLEEHHNSAERVSMINSKLERFGGTTLLILDDFPKNSKPQELGIPKNSRKCKVLLTTRDKTNCIFMGCDHSIPLQRLSDEEAMALLQSLSDVDRTRRDLFEVAREVAFKCCGLPGLVKEVVSSLKGKSVEEWKETLVSLSHSNARYQIFISFRGEVRHVFTKHLYEALCREGFKTFMDDESLKGGVQISKLLDDIEESRSSVVVFSKNYAESKWCMKELAKIRDCMNDERKKQLVLPIFYEVPPSDPKHVENSYHDAMVKHEKNGEKSETLQNWKKALHDVCSLIGYAKPAERNKDEIIQKILEFAQENRHRLHMQSMYID